MAIEDPDANDWGPGEPPWLAAYGAPPALQTQAAEYNPLGNIIANTPTPTPPPPPPPPPPPGDKKENRVDPKRAQLAEPGAQVTDEVPAGVLPPDAPAPDLATAAQASPAAPPGSPADAWTTAMFGASPAAAPTSSPAAPGLPAVGSAPELVALDPNASPSDRQAAWQRLSPEQRTNLVNSADPTKLAAIATAAMSPEDLGAIAIRHQQAQLHLQSAQQLALAQKQDEDARANFQAYQQSIQRANADTAQLSMDAQKLAQQKVDPNEHGVGHFVASVIAGTFGGAMSQYTGGRDLALEEMDKKTQQRIDAQKADIANQWQGIGFKRNLIGEQLQRSGDMYRAQEAYRISTYDRASSELQTKMQDYDPQGTTALRAAGAVQQIQAARQQALTAYNQQSFKNNLDRAKELRETVLAQSTIQKNAADIGKTQAETAKLRGELGGAGAAAGPVLPPEYFAQLGLPVPPQPMSADAYRSWTSMRNSGFEAQKAQTLAESTANSSVVRNPVTKQPFADESGKPIVILPDDAKEVQNAVVATQQTMDSLSDVRRALDADPSTFDRKEWARIQATIGGALPTLAAVYGSKFSSREETALKDITNLDYDSYVRRVKDKETGKAAVDQIIKTLSRNGDTMLGEKLGKYAGPSPFLDTSKPAPAQETSIDRTNEKLVTDLGRTPFDQIDSDDKLYMAVSSADDKGNIDPSPFLSTVAADRGEKEDETLGAIRKSPLVQRALELRVAPSKIKLLEQLRDRAIDGDKDAMAAIQNQADNGATEQMRKFAGALIQSVVAGTVPSTEKP